VLTASLASASAPPTGSLALTGSVGVLAVILGLVGLLVGLLLRRRRVR
jgi:LPXTG-motif cell wall-anchored protein